MDRMIEIRWHGRVGLDVRNKKRIEITQEITGQEIDRRWESLL